MCVASLRVVSLRVASLCVAALRVASLCVASLRTTACDGTQAHDPSIPAQHSLELEVEDINSEINRQEALVMIRQLERQRPALEAPAAVQEPVQGPRGVQWALPRAPWSIPALPTVPVEA